MRSLGKTWSVRVVYWYSRKDYTGRWVDSGRIVDTFIIEELDFMLAGTTVIEHLYKKYSDEMTYRSVHIEVTSVTEYDTPSNFLVKEY